jgi:hypothetical protein
MTVDKESAGDALLVRRVLCFFAMPGLKSERSLVELEFTFSSFGQALVPSRYSFLGSHWSKWLRPHISFLIFVQM